MQVTGYLKTKPRKEWVYDPGAIPGEPEEFLYRDGREVAAIVEDDIPHSDRNHRVVLVSGKEIGRNLTYDEAVNLAERATGEPK